MGRPAIPARERREKHSYYLPRWKAAKLEALAKKRGVPEAKLIESLVDRLLGFRK